MSKRSSLGGIVRRTLSDITNTVSQQTKSNTGKMEIPSDPSVKEYMDHLKKENTVLTRLVEDKNRIIELTGTELHKLRLNLQKLQTDLQKMQMQNWSLAQSNSHMLAELNISKDKQKVLQHENACKDVLLKIKNEESKQKVLQHENACKNGLLKGKNEESKANLKNGTNQKDSSKKGQEVGGGQISQGNPKVQKTKKGATRSQSMGPTSISQPAAEKEVSENKRRCLRRQSARVTSQEPEPAENLFEIEDTQFLNAPSVDYPLSKVSLNSSIKKEEQDNENCDPKYDVFQSRRSSLGRPTRRAAVKIQSYKEVSVNLKMRRSE